MAKPIDTRFGEVDSEVLEELTDSFDTYQLLQAVDVIDQIDTGEIRHDLMKLHGMAMGLFNDDYSQSQGPDDPDIWELADGLDMQIFEMVEGLEKVAKSLSELTRLVPDPDWVDEDEEEGEDAG